MKIRFVQSGGFVGMLRECEIDTQHLSPEEARRVADLVRTSGIPETGEYVERTREAWDLEMYRVTIEGEGRQVCVIYDELSVPPGARPLLDYLVAQARPVRRAKRPIYPS